jgi:hypothetical protein
MWCRRNNGGGIEPWLTLHQSRGRTEPLPPPMPLPPPPHQSKMMEMMMPKETWPGSGAPLLRQKPSDIMCHHYRHKVED